MNDLCSTFIATLGDTESEVVDWAASCAPEVTRRSIGFGQGHRFVLQRLGIPEASLLLEPIRVAKQLVQTV